MRDLPHHIKKLNRRVVRSARHEAEEEVSYEAAARPRVERPLRTQKRLKKEAIRKARLSHTPTHPSEEERNRKMKKRVPVFDRLSKAKPRTQKPTRKKTTRI